MNKGAYIFAVSLLAYIQSESAIMETVWLKDVTTREQTEERTNIDRHLPNELTYHLTRGSETLILNLKRNHAIDPNADMYYVRGLKDGQSVLVKTRNYEKEDTAYYQDRKNGAFVTVRCVKRANEKCNRLIDGTIRIADTSYHLRPAETDATSRSLDHQVGLRKRYILQDQALIQGEKAVEEKAHVYERKVENELTVLLRDYKQNHCSSSDAISSRNVAALHKGQATGKTRQQTKEYYVKVAVLVDSGLWDLYSSTVKTFNLLTRSRQVKKKIAHVFSHIMNGVNLLYQGIEDTSISINVILSKFIYFKQKESFPHKASKVMKLDGIKYINAAGYITDISKWDLTIGAKILPDIDHAMLFTRYKLFLGDASKTIMGYGFTGKVCETGERTSVVMADDYVSMVLTAAHELGHSLGSPHDGEGSSRRCRADDFYIMSDTKQVVYPGKPYSRNPWIFSKCSVEAFKDTLKDKRCVVKTGNFYNDEEYKEHLMMELGQVYSPNAQCELIMGHRSVCCETDPANICYLMRCTDPKTGKCSRDYFGAARGTECVNNKWCIEGRCVSRQ